MKISINRWLAPPIFDGDEKKTYRARLLNAMFNSALLVIGLTLVGNILDSSTPPRNFVIDFCIIGIFLFLRHLLFTGRVQLVAYFSTIAVFIFQTISMASEGTTLAPATALFPLMVIMTGFFFNVGGIVVAVIASSLVVGGLILARNAGILPLPHYEESTFQWFIFTITFGVTGGLAYFSQQQTQKALMLSENEIIDRKRAEAELRKLIRAVEQSPASIVITDLDGNIEYVNPRFTQVTDYSLDEAVGKNPRILKSDQTPTEVYHLLWETITQGKEWHGEFINRKKDGTLYSESATISPITDLNGTTTHYLAVKEDITARKLAEQELKQTNHRLEEAVNLAKSYAEQAGLANSSKSEFLANMSHEIRTPMNGVIGVAGLLLDTDLNEEQRRYAEVVHSSGEALLTLINDILDFSKIEAGKLDLESLDFDLQRLLDDFCMSMALLAQAKGLELVSSVDPDVPTLLRGDPGRLRQILTNLVGNAIKFTQQGEVAVWVSCLAVMEREVELRFSIRDTGIGISPENIGKLFTKFSQADVSTTRKYGGTGLGLAISKQLAELMGGEIGVESIAGGGSEFWFTVNLEYQPERAPDLSNETPVQVAAKPRSTGKLRLPTNSSARILLAEDNLTNQMVAQAILKKLGFQSDIATNGAEALNALENTRYDLVLMDMQMPEMDGLEATRRIRDIQSSVFNHNIPIIAMTANAMKEDREHCLEAGMNDYVSKPIKPQALSEMLLRWLPKEDNPNQTSTQGSLASPTGKDNLTVFDKSNLLERLMDDEELVDLVISNFLKDIPLQIQALKDCLEKDDAVGAERQSHTIKGAAANISAQALCDVANEMEVSGRNGDLSAMRERIAELERQFERLKEQLKKEM